MSPEERHRLMRAGQGAFNRAAFFEAHEHWEAAWLHAVPPERTWIQGLIQLTSALHKLSQGRPELAISLLEKGLAKLREAPSSFESLDLGGLRRDLAAVQEGLLGHLRVDPRAIKLATG